jgi:hypothetical protein
VAPAFVVLAAAASSQVEVLIAAVLGGTPFVGYAAYRKAKPEADLSTLNQMQVLIGEIRIERDEARTDRAAMRLERDAAVAARDAAVAAREEEVAKREAAEGHAMYLEGRVAALQRIPKFPPDPPAPV